MRIALTGSSGLIGTALWDFLHGKGHEIIPIPRSQEKMVAPDAVIHLAGENIASGRWTAEKKHRIRASRVDGTRHLAERLATFATPPSVLICASAVGYYGSRGDDVMTEDSMRGEGFLAELCEAWEAAAAPARERGIRVVHTRFGMVLSGKGGALPKMMRPFRFGLGGPLGNGTQWMSWVAIDDVCEAIAHILATPSLHGPLNVTSPNPVRNRDFTQTLAKALRRPALFPVPAFALRLVLGEMADELLLASCRAIPKVLLESGYAFRYPHLSDCLSVLK